jgi:hypothetical protein
VLSPEQRQEFAERGFVRLRSAFSRAEAAAMEERLWERLGQRHGIRQDDPLSWRLPAASGLQAFRTDEVFEPIGGPPLCGALDDLLGEGRWQPPKHWGQLLISFPHQEGSPAPKTIWHTDFPYSLPVDRVAGVLVFSFIGRVPADGGGTRVVAGSPRVVARFIEENPRLRRGKMKFARQALMHSDPWLKALCAESDEPGGMDRFANEDHSIGDVPVRVVELTGEPGDVVLGHPWLLHTPVPNRGERPRFMRAQRIVGGGSG